MSAYVEMVFDNSDHRFPTGREEVILRRTIGLKKDEYSLDRRPVSKQDVANLLQSAGFSRSNPYFIVPQGRITALCNARDEERLELLKEVAGTRVYEEHREESLRILEETEGKRTKIASLLKLIDERLAELEAERAALHQHQELERRRRTIQQALAAQEEAAALAQLLQLEAEHAPLLQQAADQRAAQEARAAQLSHLRQQAEEGRRQLAELAEELEEEPELADLMEQGEQIHDESLGGLSALTLSGLTAQLARIEAELAEQEQALRTAPPAVQLPKLEAQLRAERERTEEELAACSRQLKQAQGEKSEQSQQLASLQAEREALRARAGRAKQFRSAAERDRWLKGQLDLIRQQQQTLQLQQQQATEEAAVAAQRLADLEAQANSAKAEADPRLLQKQLSAAIAARRELWRVQAKLEGSLRSLEAEAERSRQGLLAGGGESGLAACLATKEAAARLGIPVHGALFELFEAEPVFHAAIETVASSGLWQLVVDTDAQAARLLEVVRREGLGRVTVVPLNRLRVNDEESFSWPEGVVPLLNHVRITSEACAPAVRQVLGRAVLCQSLSVAAAVARSHRVTAVTLSGDRVDRKGALYGGGDASAGHGGGKALLSGAQRLLELQARLAEHGRLLAEVKGRLEQAEVNCQRAQAALHKQQSPKGQDWLTSELTAARELQATRQREAEQLAGEAQALASQAQSLQAELGTPMAALGPAEQARLRQLVKDTEDLHAALTGLAERLAALEAEQSRLETLLAGALARRQTELVRWRAQWEQVPLLQAELGRLRLLRNRWLAWRQERAERRARLEAEVGSLEASLATLVDNETEGEGSSALDRYLARRAVLVAQREAAMAQGRGSGGVDAQLLEELAPLPAPSLLTMLHGCQEQLRLQGPVNRRAADQWATYARQGETLRSRHQELERSAQAIRDFIGVLEGRRGEALHRTFGQVAEQFSRLWQQLVPAGQGELQMQQPQVGAEYTGVSIRVSFNSQADEGLLTGQLSGGQKSLVALCLILAIQQTDPAPFYLFDEIDANLDGAYRASVAQLLASIAATGATQFIVTTFRPEFVREANQWYGVTHSGRVSRIESITRDAAMAFVEHGE